MLRDILVAVMIGCFVWIGLIDLVNANYKIGVASMLLGIVNGLFLWG